jgi:hypothetical protein
MLDWMGAETWVPDRECFMFRVEAAGSRWTFLVERATLQALAGESDPDLEAVFDEHREAIYEAALKRMANATPSDQHRLALRDIDGFRDTVTS